MPSLSAIRVFPVKSLDGVTLDHCRVLPGGALEHDRLFALIDSDGNFVNGKRHAAIHQLRATFDLGNRMITLSKNGEMPTPFHLDDEQALLSRWFSDFFGFAVRLQKNDEQGFPDDVDSPGPTVISTATLQTVAEWFPQDLSSTLWRRFRANLELAGDEPFWEDRLYSEHSGVRFRIGDVEFLGTNPCQRCVVPTRSPDSGEPLPAFARHFAEQRQRTLPPWSAALRFDHFYRLAVNTRLAALHSGRLQVGDEVQIVH